MSGKFNKIEDFMFSAKLLIDASLSDAEIKAIAAQYSYSEAKLLAGQNLFNEVETLNLAQKKEYGEQLEATSELNTFWEKAHSDYMKLVKITRVALSTNTKVVKALDLMSARKESLSGWYDQANQFYSNLQADARAMAREFQEEYNNEREHSSLTGLTPLEFKQKMTATISQRVG